MKILSFLKELMLIVFIDIFYTRYQVSKEELTELAFSVLVVLGSCTLLWAGLWLYSQVFM